MQLHEVDIKQFVKLVYDEDEMDLYMQYVDTSGIGRTREYELNVAIHNLQIRLNTISNLLQVQYLFLRYFEMPYIDAFVEFRKFGYRLKWNPEDPVKLVDQLEAIESEEKRYVAEIDSYVKDLGKLKKGDYKFDRKDFFKYKNTVANWLKYGIAMDTDMLSYSLQLKEYTDAVNN